MHEQPLTGYVKIGEPLARDVAAPASAAASTPTAAPASQPDAAAPARFSLLYESRDRRLCLFEDADGHLTSVDSDRFA